MRERFIAILVGLTVTVIALYGIPRAYYMANIVEDQETEEISRAADFIQERIRSRLAAGSEVDEDLLLSALDETDGASYVGPGGAELTVGDFEVDPEQSIVEERRPSGGGHLVVTRDRTVVDKGVQSALLPLILLALGLAALAAVIAWFVAGRATAAFRQLAAAAEDLGKGNFELDVPERGVPEALAIGAALQDTAARLEQLVRREREFAANASHQLRTPITALRLELEDLTYWDETAPAVADHLRTSLKELERLNEAIDDLLGMARLQRHERTLPVDLTAFAGDVVQRWQARFEVEGREITLAPSLPVPAEIAPGPAAQVLDVLLENARLHGSGTVTVATSDEGTHTSLRVADEGARTFGSEVFQRGVSSRLTDGAGSGIGLAVAAELAEASGWRLTLDEQARSTIFVLLLPTAD